MFERGVAQSVDMTSLSFILMVKCSEERGAGIFQREKDVMLPSTSDTDTECVRDM